tara:strand:- start:26 stop:1054 length:1029 start_codon:yes stop_codon:yes gene_type:complete
MSIFTSEAKVWDPVAPPPLSPPPTKCRTSPNNNEDCIVRESTLSSDAFEIFSGKLIALPRKGHSSRITNETKLERFYRLKKEIDELVVDFEESRSSLGDNDWNKNEKVIVLQLIADATKLSSNLSSVQSGSSITASGIIDRVLNNSSSNNTNTNNTNDDREKLKAMLENRIAVIENKFSSLESTELLNSSLLERLTKLESSHNPFHKSSIKSIRAEANLIKNDLEAAASAQSRIFKLRKGATDDSATSAAAEDSKVISKLHDRYIELEQISEKLPQIVARLSRLSTIHQKAGTFGNRLSAVEKFTNDAVNVIGSLEKNLVLVEKNMVENFKTIKENLKVKEY